MSFDEKGYVLSPADGTHLWFLDTRMTIKAGGAQTGGAFAFIEWAAPLGFGPPLHVHGLDDEGFYILEGEISVECGDRTFTAGPGDFTFLPRGIPHTFLVTRGPVRGLQITAPAGFDAFITEAARPAAGPGLPEPAEPDIPRLLAASERYQNQILGPPRRLPAAGAGATQD
jgi:mannose-6-phosphate isomerase-like protein (cupin superfamily)